MCRDGMRHEFRLGRNRSSRLTESPCKPHVHISLVERKLQTHFRIYKSLRIVSINETATISLLLLWCSETIEAQQDGQLTTTSMTSKKWWIQRRRWDDEGPCTQRKTKVRRVQLLFFFFFWSMKNRTQVITPCQSNWNPSFIPFAQISNLMLLYITT